MALSTHDAFIKSPVSLSEKTTEESQSYAMHCWLLSEEWMGGKVKKEMGGEEERKLWLVCKINFKN